MLFGMCRSVKQDDQAIAPFSLAFDEAVAPVPERRERPDSFLQRDLSPLAARREMKDLAVAAALAVVLHSQREVEPCTLLEAANGKIADGGEDDRLGQRAAATKYPAG